MNILSKMNFKRQNLDLVVLFLASIIIVLPIFIWGVPNGNDTTQHYQFAITFFDSIQNGNLYPGWASNTNHGFGDVSVRFYPPLAYYVMVAFRFLSGNWYDASALSFLFWFFAGGVGVYFWCREWFGENASLAAGVVFIYMPYHANHIYNAFMYAEFAGTSVLPFCFLFVTRLCRTGKAVDVLGLAFFYSILILTHLPLTVIGSISLLIYSLASLKKENFFSTVSKLAVAVFLGLSASSFYWLRMATELNLVQITTNTGFTQNVYDFRENFLCLFLNRSSFNENSDLFRYCDLLLLVSAAIFVPCAIVFYARSRGKTDHKLFNVAILLTFAVFITTPFSISIWENFPVLQKVQFPWRWLAIISMTGAVFVAACFDDLTAMFSTKRRPFTILIGGAIITGIIFTFTGLLSTPLQMPRREFAEQTKNLLSSESFQWSWTSWSRKDAFNLTQKVSVEDHSTQIISWQPTEREIIFSDGKTTNAKIATFYYPHWKATVNNQLTELQLAEDGAMILPLPPEKADVKIWFQEPFHIRAAFYSSAITWLIFGFLFIYYKSHKYFLPFKVI